MKTLLFAIAATLFIISCTKGVESFQKENKSKNISSLTTYYFDTVYDLDPNDTYNMPFDSCTNEYVSLQGRVHVGYLTVIDDSVKIKDSSWLKYDSVYGVGLTTGNSYRCYKHTTSRQIDIWLDSNYFQIRNYYHAKLSLKTAGDGNDFVVEGLIHIVADSTGKILLYEVSNNNGECK